MRNSKDEPIYKTESELCAAYIEWAKPFGWNAYAETAGWDVLMVNANGVQLGVQAKLTLNLKVIAQSGPDFWTLGRVGPDYRAILLPKAFDAMFVVRALGFGVFYPFDRYRSLEACRSNPRFNSTFPDAAGRSNSPDNWHDWNPEARHPLPDYVPDVAAGASAPLQLTKWKVGALRLTAWLELQGYLTRDDFKRYAIDYRRWVGPHGWLVPGDHRGQWVAGPDLRFAVQHPKVYAEILAEEQAKFEKRLQSEYLL